jgi:HAD superfamily hydrolase (TIGR01509 family)
VSRSKKYILWDNDGVLVDTEYWYFKSTQRALAALGVELDRATYLGNMVHGTPSWNLARELGCEEAEIQQKQRERDAYYQEYLTRENLDIEGVVKTLEVLSRSHRMAIVTTSKRRDFELIHKNRDIVSFMEFVLAREDYDKAKPEPEPYLTALDRFDALPEEALVVEDSQRGLGAAIAAGIDCAIVHNDFTASHDFSGARYRLESIAELPQLLN